MLRNYKIDEIKNKLLIKNFDFSKFNDKDTKDSYFLEKKKKEWRGMDDAKDGDRYRV